MFHRMLPTRRVNTTPGAPRQSLRFHPTNSEQPVPHETHSISNPAGS